MFWPHLKGSTTYIWYSVTTYLPQGHYFQSLVHAGYLFCNWHPLNTNYYGTNFGRMPWYFDSSQINMCVVRIGVLGPRFIVSSNEYGLHKMLHPRGFEPFTSHMPGKHRTPRPRLPLSFYGLIFWKKIDTTILMLILFRASLLSSWELLDTLSAHSLSFVSF